MCGINAFIGTDKDKLDKMNAVTCHRGPDFSGTYIDDTVALGHNLLAIRDVSEKSKQPYQLDSEWLLVFNGQIYNTEQLRSELGITETLDTHILYKTIEKYGWNFIKKIHGMFAIVVYNTKEKKLRAYRDQSGQKNLYYYEKDGSFIVSSEIKGILVHSIDRTVDTEAVHIAEYLGYIPRDKTLFKYIKKIEPGQFVGNNEKGFFTFETENYYPHDPEKAFEQLAREHIQSKDRVSINLSGGLDSSLLLYEIAKTGYTIDSYTTSFDIDQPVFNEDADLAKKLSADYGTVHHDIHITKDDYTKNFIEAYRIIEEPNYNISNPIYLITAKTEGIHGDKKRVTISGDGGDEIFGGYSYYREQLRLDAQMRFIPKPIYNSIKNYRNRTTIDYTDLDARWLQSKRVASNAKFLHMLKEVSSTHPETVRHMMENDRVFWLAGENFIRSDKLYMSQSMELRSPFAYTPFQHYIDSLLTKNDYFSTDQNKIWLRKYAESRLPDYITKRPNKTGWRAPIEYWYDAGIKKMFLDIIGTRKNNVIDWDNVRSMIGDTWPGKKIHIYLSLAILSDEFNLTI